MQILYIQGMPYGVILDSGEQCIHHCKTIKNEIPAGHRRWCDDCINNTAI